MLIIGLTGSIGMGKSTVAGHFADHGIPVCDADAEVHKLYENEAVSPIDEAFPGVVHNGVVDRQKLAAALINDPTGFKKLEAIVHPLVRHAEQMFLQKHARAGAPAAVLEIPLLFETGGDKLVDVTVVASTSAQNQKERVLERPGMTEAKLESVLSRQVPDAEKRARADFVVDTSGPIEQAARQVDKIIESLVDGPAHAFKAHWAG